MQRIFRENDQIQARLVAPRLGDQIDDHLRLSRKVVVCHRNRKLQLDETDADAMFGLVETAETIHGRSFIS